MQAALQQSVIRIHNPSLPPKSICIQMQNDARTPNLTMVLSSNREHWPSNGLCNVTTGDPEQEKRHKVKEEQIKEKDKHYLGIWYDGNGEGTSE